jgi:hypothetical protein
MLLHVPQALPEERQNVLIVECVVDEPSFAPGPDDPSVPQQPKLMRNRRLGQPEQPGEVANAELAPRQHVENANPRGIAEYFEDVCKRADAIGAEELAPVNL